jgi:thiamine kinase-like enzyme
MTTKLFDVLEAVRPKAIAQLLSDGLLPAEHRVHWKSITLDCTRLEAPNCFWAVYAVHLNGTIGRPTRLTLKTFFGDSDFEAYAEKLREREPERIGDLLHRRGGIAFLPDEATVLWTLPYDPRLPGLANATDGHVVAPVLGVEPADLAVEVVKYRPELDATLRYVAAGETLAYGKVSSAKRAARSFSALKAVHKLQQREPAFVQVPKPLAFVPEGDLMLQGTVPGEAIDSDRSAPRFAEVADVAARTLAAIHGSDISLGHTHTLEHDIRHLRGMLPEFAVAAPELYLSLRKLLGHVEDRAAAVEPGPYVPSHGDFKYNQFLWDGERFYLIDFEAFCQAEAAYDVGYFCGYLPSSSLTSWEEADSAENLRHRFLAAYVEAAGDLDGRRAVLHEATTLALRASTLLWRQGRGWQVSAGSLIDLAFERLASYRDDTLIRD